MSDYPEIENSGHIDFLETPLPRALLNLNEKHQESEAKLRRMDEAILCFEKMLSRYSAHYSQVRTPVQDMQMLGEISAYALNGIKSPEIRLSLSEMGR